MTTDVNGKQLTVGVVAIFPRQFYLYADESCPAYDRLVETLEARGIAERHMTGNGQTIGARTGVEDIRIRAPFGDRSGPQLADTLAEAFRDLAVRAGIGVRVFIRRKEHETKSEEDHVMLGLPGTDIDADHAALRRLLNEAAATAGLLARVSD